MDLVSHIRSSFSGKTILVLGDAVADQFLAGTISRVSREAPVFILRHEETLTLPGAAANAASNVAALGGNANLVSVVGKDENGSRLLESLESAGVSTDSIVRSQETQTVTKVRVLAGQSYAPRQQVIRIDYERQSDLASETMDALRARLVDAAASAHAILVSDYGYGTITSELFAEAKRISLERAIPLIVDSRYRLTELVGGTSATPNREEVEQILGSDFSDADCASLGTRLGLKALLVTHGNQGMSLFDGKEAPIRFPAVGPSEPVDVTGAGDTVIAAYSLGIASGLGFREAAEIANHAGGIVVMKKGTATASVPELIASLSAGSENTRAQSR